MLHSITRCLSLEIKVITWRNGCTERKQKKNLIHATVCMYVRTYLAPFYSHALRVLTACPTLPYLRKIPSFPEILFDPDKLPSPRCDWLKFCALCKAEASTAKIEGPNGATVERLVSATTTNLMHRTNFSQKVWPKGCLPLHLFNFLSLFWVAHSTSSHISFCCLLNGLIAPRRPFYIFLFKIAWPKSIHSHFSLLVALRRYRRKYLDL